LVVLYGQGGEVQETKCTAILLEVVYYLSKRCKIPSRLNFEMFWNLYVVVERCLLLRGDHVLDVF